MARNRLQSRKIIKDITLDTFFPQTTIPLFDREEYSKILDLEEQGFIRWEKKWAKMVLPMSNETVIYRGYYSKKNKTAICTLGEILFQDGTLYRGQIINQAINGRGVLKSKEGTKYTGYFKDGEYEGEGAFEDPSKHYIYKGNWSNNLQNGFGI